MHEISSEEGPRRCSEIGNHYATQRMPEEEKNRRTNEEQVLKTVKISDHTTIYPQIPTLRSLAHTGDSVYLCVPRLDTRCLIFCNSMTFQQQHHVAVHVQTDFEQLHYSK